MVLTLVPRELSEFAPLFCRSCRKFVRNDCRAALDVLPPLDVLLPAFEVLPPKSPINFSNAELRFDSALDDRLKEESVLLSTWLLLRSCTSASSAETMLVWPYAPTPVFVAVPVLAAAPVAAVPLEGAGVEAAGAVLLTGVGAVATVPLLTGDAIAAEPLPVAAGGVTGRGAPA